MSAGPAPARTGPDAASDARHATWKRPGVPTTARGRGPVPPPRLSLPAAALVLTLVTACGAEAEGLRPSPDDVATGVAAFYTREAPPHALRLTRTDLLALDADPADAGAWVALVAVKGAVGEPARAFDDTLEVSLRPGVGRTWTSAVRPVPTSPPPDPAP